MALSFVLGLAVLFLMGSRSSAGGAWYLVQQRTARVCFPSACGCFKKRRLASVCPPDVTVLKVVARLNLKCWLGVLVAQSVC